MFSMEALGKNWESLQTSVGRVTASVQQDLETGEVLTRLVETGKQSAASISGLAEDAVRRANSAITESGNPQAPPVHDEWDDDTPPSDQRLIQNLGFSSF